MVKEKWRLKWLKPPQGTALLLLLHVADELTELSVNWTINQGSMFVISERNARENERDRIFAAVQCEIYGRIAART